ncbi:RasGEF domain protein [Ceratobasidium sp. AG-Ba]|nr:RasGEF domain protein [Ceratobasidium sp. AG-Ba]
MLIKEMGYENQSASMNNSNEDTSRVHTPTPISRTFPRHEILSAPVILPPIDVTGAPTDYDSGNDTELEEISNAQPSLGAFSSFDTRPTAATSPDSSILQTDLANTVLSTLSPSFSSLRKSISADRLTARSTQTVVPPPLVRTKSEGPTVALFASMDPISAHFTEPLLSSDRATKIHARAAGNNTRMDVNALLNTFCGDHGYLNRSDGSIYASDSESNDGTLGSKRKAVGTLDSLSLTDDESLELLVKDKGKVRVHGSVGYDSDGVYLSAASDTDPSPSTSIHRSRRLNFGSSENTDEEVRYDTVSEGISDSEDIDISPYIPATTPLPPLPPPTVSRSRSSSRSYPSAPPESNIPPVPPLPAFAILGGRTRALSSPRLLSDSSPSLPPQDQRSLQTPTPTQPPSAALPPTPSSASISSNTSFSSMSIDPRLGPSPSTVPLSQPQKSRQRSVSESGGGSGSGSGSNSRGRFHQLAQVLRKSPSVSPGRGIEHIKPVPGRSKDRPKFTIAFVGSAGCGKTTIIEKASKSANSRFKQETTKRNICYGGEKLTVEFRDVAVVVDKTRNTAPVSTIEIDSAPLLGALDRGCEFWPESLPGIDGVVLCYDASSEGNEGGSFSSIERLNNAFAARRYPIIWVGCKSDWIRQPKKDNGQPSSPRVLPEGIVPPHEVFIKAREAHTGLIEVAKGSSYGKEQMRNLFTWMYKSAARLRREREKQQNTCNECLNHASPEVLDRRPSQKAQRQVFAKPPDLPVLTNPSEPSSTPHTDAPVSPTSLPLPRSPMTRARSISDLLSQEARDRVAETSAAILRKASATVTATQLPRNTDEPSERSRDTERASTPVPEPETERDSRSGEAANNTSIVILPPRLRIDPFAFMTLDDMIVRLSGGKVPGYDILFNQDFMLTYRRFATPREVLLAMIRRLRTITYNEEMRRAVLILFDYLLDWTYQYPEDFAAPGAMAPFEVLIRMFRDSYSHQGAPKLKERTEFLQSQTDDVTDWAKPETRFTEGDDSDGEDLDNRSNNTELRAQPIGSIKVSVSTSVDVTPALELDLEAANGSNVSNNEPPTAGLRPKSFFLRRNSMDPAPPLTMSEKDERELRRLAKTVLSMEPELFAEEITREDKSIFMALKARDWLRHAYTTRRDRDPAVHPLDRASYRFERIGHIVASLILILNKTRQRSYMFEFWIKVATFLRSYNNFAALHTVVAAMDKVYAGSDGAEIERFVHAGDLDWNKFLSMRVLILKSNGGAYKTALKHASLPLIPTMAIHTSDIVRVMSNRDYKEGNPQLIHWGKFQIIARIAKQMLELQGRIQRTSAYNFQPHPEVAQILRDIKPMSEEMIVEKTYPPLEDLPPPKPGSAWSARVIRKVLK